MNINLHCCRAQTTNLCEPFIFYSSLLLYSNSGKQQFVPNPCTMLCLDFQMLAISVQPFEVKTHQGYRSIGGNFMQILCNWGGILCNSILFSTEITFVTCITKHQFLCGVSLWSHFIWYEQISLSLNPSSTGLLVL